MGRLCFAMSVFLTLRGPLASHDSNPYPNRTRIARYNATKFLAGRVSQADFDAAETFFPDCPATRHQKNPRVRKIRVRNSGAGNGCANFMDTWKNAFFLQENPCP